MAPSRRTNNFDVTVSILKSTADGYSACSRLTGGSPGCVLIQRAALEGGCRLIARPTTDRMFSKATI
jgi:hypothetical protein